MTFSDLGLAAPLLRALAAQGYTVPTPIQAQAIPPAMAGHDILGCAQTGTGKTAAFALPLLHRLFEARPQGAPSGPPPNPEAHFQQQRQRRGRRPDRPQEPYRPLKVLVLAPTRELAVQIAESIHDYGEYTGLNLAAIYGGVGYQRQIQSLRRGIDILVATPGRLVDLMEQGYVDFSSLQSFVLDEADRMLDMGFMPDLRRIISQLPEDKQTLFFSATMPPEIARLAQELLHEPARISIAPEKPTADRVEQSVCFVPRSHKSALLTRWLSDHQITRAIVFTKTKHGADRVARQLEAAGVRSEAIHGNKSQNARQRTLQAFRESAVHVLVATDLAARGIDVDGVSHVFNYDLPIEPETYVHRIGRTARAGASGSAVSFCDRDERGMLRGIERLLKRQIKVETNLPVVVPLKEEPEKSEHGQDRGPRRPPQGLARGPRPPRERQDQGAGAERRPERPAGPRPGKPASHAPRPAVAMADAPPRPQRPGEPRRDRRPGKPRRPSR